MTFGCLVADEVGYFVVEDVEMGDGLWSLFSPHPFGKLRAGSNPISRGEGTLNGTLALILRDRGVVVALGVGEAVLDELLCCVHAVVDFDAGGFALHCADEEGGDRVAFPSAVDDVLLELCWDAHWR